MSELEIRRRQEYKRKRRQRMIIQIIAIAIAVAISLTSFVIYNRVNSEYYIEYTEHSDIDYKVQYRQNEFFEQEWVEKGKEYISYLVNSISADFKYNMHMDAANVGFDYEYSIIAKVLVADMDSGNAYFTQEEVLVPLKTQSATSASAIAITESVDIDYLKYDAIAHKFVDTYGLTQASCTLIVTLNVDVLSSCDEFEQENRNNYMVSLNVPLVDDTFSIERTSSAPDDQSKVLACRGSVCQKVFIYVGAAFAAVALILGIVLAIYLHVTVNDDITYDAKIRRLVRSYGSYIQRISGEFDDKGYQTVIIKTFTEMLGIRDTIQSPILMTENRDETMTRFLIPTNTDILYVHEIKVDNYDEIYGENIENVEDVEKDENEQA